MIKRYILTIIASLMVSLGGIAQIADKAQHDKVAAVIKVLYNQKKFDLIYGQLSLNFKSATPQQQFIAFLEQSIYTPMGEMESLEFVGEEQGLFSYLAQFKTTRLRMNLAVNALDQVEGLQFVPYSLPFKTKLLDYGSDNPKQSGIDLFIDSLVRPYLQSPQNCGLSIGISQKGKYSFYNYGETKRASKQLPNQTTIYEIGSLSKTFCGLLLARAILDKKIKADDDIRVYLPGNYPSLVYGRHPILVKHLANHTSGLPRIPDDLRSQAGFDSLNPYKHYNRQQVFTYLKTATLSAQPGQVCEYSTLGMALLGIILEDLYGQNFETLVKEKITAPHDMASTTIHVSPEQQLRFAEGYNGEGDPTPHWELGDFAAAGGLRSSAEDMLKYLDYNLSEKDGMTQLAHTVSYRGHETLGLAWFIKTTKQGNTLLWHNGATFGFSCFGGCIKEKNCSFIVLSNSAGNADALAIAILNYLQN